jgi:3-hydroxyisobutyrate dehydrogenase-like beta-hydroxyacid dehydrogenase
MNVGVIGLGRIGRPMAARLLAAGFGVVVHNRSRGPVEARVAAGAADGGSAEGVGAAAGIVITLLPDPALARRLAAALHERGAGRSTPPSPAGSRARARGR